jgi:hypothetical protein
LIDKIGRHRRWQLLGRHSWAMPDLDRFKSEMEVING